MQATLRAVRPHRCTARHADEAGAFGLFVASFVLGIAIAARLFWLQVVHHSEYVERAHKQQQRTFESLPPRRSTIAICELAMTVQVDSILRRPTEIDDKNSPTPVRLPRVRFAASVTSTRQTRRPAKIKSPSAWKGSRICLGASRLRGNLRARQSSESQGNLLPEGISTLLSRQPDRRTGAGLCGTRRQWPRRPRAKIRFAPPRRQAACSPQWMLVAACWDPLRRSRARPESPAHHRRKHPVHG